MLFKNIIITKVKDKFIKKFYTYYMFDFDKIISRKGTNSLKWDEKPDSLPLWVADMDFETAPCVKQAILNRADHGIYGYSVIGNEWADAYYNWWKRRHRFEIKKNDLIFCTGVVPAISSLVRKLTTPAEKVLIQTPVYNIFFNSIINNGRYVVESPLLYDEKTRSYSIDFTQLEKDLSDPQVSLMILCNPHNPTGNIWTKDELCRVGNLCKKYNVTVLSDEIHCDILRPGFYYTPFASASEICREISVTCLAPSKAFNIAGINTAAVYTENPGLHHKVWRSLNTDEIAEPNVFAIQATVAAFTDGEEWLCELNEYLAKNRDFAEEFIDKNLKNLKYVPSNSTYLLWADVSKTGLSGDDFAQKLLEKTELFISGGRQYGKAGENFVRINLACPRSVLKEALGKIEAYFL